MFNQLLNTGKDLAVSLTIKKVINMKINKFGEVSKLDFNTTNKQPIPILKPYSRDYGKMSIKNEKVTRDIQRRDK